VADVAALGLHSPWDHSCAISAGHLLFETVGLAGCRPGAGRWARGECRVGGGGGVVARSGSSVFRTAGCPCSTAVRTVGLSVPSAIRTGWSGLSTVVRRVCRLGGSLRSLYIGVIGMSVGVVSRSASVVFTVVAGRLSPVWGSGGGAGAVRWGVWAAVSFRFGAFRDRGKQVNTVSGSVIKETVRATGAAGPGRVVGR